jgi:hypothetical protein
MPTEAIDAVGNMHTVHPYGNWTRSALIHLHLQNSSTHEDWEHDIQSRMLFDSEDKRWINTPGFYEACYNDSIRRIVRVEDVSSFDPPPAKAEQHQLDMQL